MPYSISCSIYLKDSCTETADVDIYEKANLIFAFKTEVMTWLPWVIVQEYKFILESWFFRVLSIFSIDQVKASNSRFLLLVFLCFTFLSIFAQFYSILWVFQSKTKFQCVFIQSLPFSFFVPQVPSIKLEFFKHS